MDTRRLHSRRLSDLVDSLPPPWPKDPCPQILTAIRRSGRKVVVLDDDPTGTQTVHGVSILAGWTVAELADALGEPETAFYILTNSRSLPESQAVSLAREIAHNLSAASRLAGRDFVVVSRSDSTLRGHYPAEVDALADTLEAELGATFDGILIVPFFLEGGRYTVDDVHWVAQGEQVVPAADTEFARDPAFGYHQSDLRLWVEEKSGGRIAAGRVRSISLELLRRAGPAAVTEALRAVRDRSPVVVNAAAYRDLEVLVAGLLGAEQAGKRFLYRTAASFVRVRSLIPERGLLSPHELFLPEARRGPGLVVVGSHVQRSSVQLRALAGIPRLQVLELGVPQVLEPGARHGALKSLADAAVAGLEAGNDVAIATSREVIAGTSPEHSLAIAGAVSAALCEVTRAVLERARPAFIVAKGGITSSDLATRALGVRRALVLGQVQPGVPVWRLGAESRLPGAPYVVFPGNVGGPDTLRLIVEACRGSSACAP
ncbi:MAG: four-carbon acid sugar kinase family protein [Anaerolineae bacterium]|nr:four-carbon acid sugar kinase family protein [Anaerolineae bacterium]